MMLSIIINIPITKTLKMEHLLKTCEKWRQRDIYIDKTVGGEGGRGNASQKGNSRKPCGSCSMK